MVGASCGEAGRMRGGEGVILFMTELGEGAGSGELISEVGRLGR